MGCNGINLMPENLDLEKRGDIYPEARLFGSLHITGVPFHVDMIEVDAVDDDGNGVQHAVDPTLEPELDALAQIDCDCGWSTVTIDEREYVVIIYPYSR